MSFPSFAGHVIRFESYFCTWSTCKGGTNYWNYPWGKYPNLLISNTGQWTQWSLVDSQIAISTKTITPNTNLIPSLLRLVTAQVATVENKLSTKPADLSVRRRRVLMNEVNEWGKNCSSRKGTMVSRRTIILTHVNPIIKTSTWKKDSLGKNDRRRKLFRKKESKKARK